jgi:hypothetical protein
MAFSPVGQQYKPDNLASGGASEKPFAEAGAPKAGGPGSSLVSSMLRLAMRRLPGSGFGAMTSPAKTMGVKPPSNAMTMGSHGKIT